MHMLRHDNASGNSEEIAPADTLQRTFKKLDDGRCRQIRSPAIATEGEEMELSRLLVTDTPAFHAASIFHLQTVVQPPASPVANCEGPGGALPCGS